MIDAPWLSGTAALGFPGKATAAAARSARITMRAGSAAAQVIIVRDFVAKDRILISPSGEPFAPRLI
jgi:hypothetical protein